MVIPKLAPFTPVGTAGVAKVASVHVLAGANVGVCVQ